MRDTVRFHTIRPRATVPCILLLLIRLIRVIRGSSPSCIIGVDRWHGSIGRGEQGRWLDQKRTGYNGPGQVYEFGKREVEKADIDQYPMENESTMIWQGPRLD